MEEIWKDIDEFDGKYQVSNKGNVQSLNYNNTGKPALLKPKINRLGYREVKLSKNNKTKNFLVSTLVALAFVPNPHNKPKVTHKDNDKQNDTPENLKWVYDSELRFMMYEKGNRKIGKPSGNIIGYKGKQYKKYADLARANGITPHQLYKRLSRGWKFKEAIETPIEREDKMVHVPKHEYYDKELTIKEISKITGTPIKLIYKRLHRKWGVEESAEVPNLRDRKEVG